MWGKPDHRHRANGEGRITPTCVGKAMLQVSSRRSSQDHPHMCGESTDIRPLAVRLTGSPPHVWGKLILDTITTLIKRITPTCVGKAGGRIVGAADG